MKTFVGITGTTSVGKSTVAVHLAQLMNTEVISADSMQIYKGMDIGTAKIRPEEMHGIKHHMIDIVEPNYNYSSFLYQQDASNIIDEMKSVPIVVGGTGFYFDSLIYPPEFGNSTTDRRVELQEILDSKGIAALQEKLKKLDEQTYSDIDLCNPKRIIRAIEIAECGKPKSQGLGRKNPHYNMILFVLERDREKLYTQIDNRVDDMIKQGLVEEVCNIVDQYGYCNTTAFSAIGYKEIIEYLRNNVTLQEAIDKIKINTRHYAKRQITYYKKLNVTEYIDVEGKNSAEIASYIHNKLINNGII